MAHKTRSLTTLTLLFLMLLYSFFMSNGLDTKDSGEFLVCAGRLIPSHSPGSVLYIIFANLFSRIGPIGVNIVSLLFSVFSAFILIRSAKEKNLITGVVLIIFTFQSVVYYSTSAEIYTMVLFLCSLLYYFSVKDNAEAVAFTAGLLGLLSPVYLILSLPYITIFFKGKEKKIIYLSLFFLPLFLYLFVTFRLEYIENTLSFESLKDTFHFMTGKDFQVKANVLSFDPLWSFNNLKILLIKLVNTPSIVFIMLLSFLIRPEFDKKIGSVLTILLYGVFFILLRLEVKNVFHFFIPVIPFLISFLDNAFKNRYTNIDKKWMFLFFLFPVFLNLYLLDIDHTDLPRKYADDVINIVKEPALVIVSVDNRINYFDFMKEYTLETNKDIIFINLAHLSKEYYVKAFSEELVLPDMIDENELINLKNIISLNSEKRNIYFDVHPSLYGLDMKVNSHGLLFSTNLRTKDWNALFDKLRHILEFNGKSLNDPEFKNLIISYKIALNEIKENLENQEIKKEINRWLDRYQF